MRLRIVIAAIVVSTGAHAATVLPVFTNDTSANTLTFNDTFGHNVNIGSYNPATGAWLISAGSGVTALSWTGGLVSIANPTTTPAFTVASTSGGIPYFDSATSWNTNAALGANQLVLGGGAGAAPSTPVSLGTTTQLLHGNAAGAPTFGAIVSADVATVLASPPAIGGTAAGSGAFTTLSASGAVSGAGMTSRFASPGPIGSTAASTGAFTTVSASSTVSGPGSPPIGTTTPNTGAFTTLFATSFGIGTSALVGDGVTNNDAALQAALTSIASGGIIFLPCGTYKITAGMALAVAAGKHVSVKGAGADCVNIAVSGAGLTCFTFNYGSPASSVSLQDLTMTTDQAGGTAAIKLALAPAGAGSNASVSDITNVTVRGSDGFGVTKYWSTGFIQSNVSNVNLYGYNYWGGTCSSNLCNGVGASLAGSSGISSYAVATNVANSSFNNCSQGIFYGDWYQGLQVANTNFTGCQHGIIEIGSHTGVLGEMSVANSQFSTYVDSINFGSSIQGVNLSNNYFIIQPSTTAVVLSLTVNPVITANQFSGVNTTAVGISLGGTTSGGIITGNTFSTLSVGVSGTGNQQGLIIAANKFTSVSFNFSWSSVSNVIFDDLTQYTVSTLNSNEPCSSGIKGSHASITDAAASPAYMATATGGGSIPLRVVCDGTNWKNE
jgi:hypothetical protein